MALAQDEGLATPRSRQVRKARDAMRMPASSRDARGGGSALKPFAALETVAAARRPLSVTELAVLLGVPKPTMHRIVRQLEGEGLIRREPHGRRYEPGPRLLGFALDVVRTSLGTAPVHAILEALSAQIGETCNLGMMVGNAVVYLDRVEAAWPFGLKFEPGSRVPLHCTSMGKLFLGTLPRQRREALIRASSLYAYTENTIVDPDALRAELERIRRDGYAVDNQEFLAGVICLAVPVRDARDRVFAALAVSAPQARLPVARAIGHLPLLRRAAQDLAAELGPANGPSEPRRCP